MEIAVANRYKLKKYNVITSSDIGIFIINKNDTGVGWQLSQFGTYDQKELEAIREIMRFLRTLNPKLVALDIGANIGIHSVVLSSEVGEGRVYSFEAQRVVFNMLVGNIALNSLENVFCYHNAVSNQNELIDIPTFDYGKPMSFGSVEFGGAQNESIGQAPFFGACEKVPTIVLDEVNFQQVNFMKIDVEGMEIKVLLGAKNLIDKFKPIILVEYLKSDKDELIYFLKNMDYKIYIGLGANYLCVPINLKFSLNSLQEVT